MNRRLFVKVLGVGFLAMGCAGPAASPTAAPPPPRQEASPAAPAKATAPAAKPAATVAPEKPATKAPAPAKPLQEVTFRLDWRAIGYHAPFWSAVDKGYFAEQGLDVKLFEGQGSASVLQLIASGTQMFGFMDAGVMAQGVQKGIDCRMIACVFQRNMFGILSPKDAPLTKPEDLVGKNIAGSVGGAGEIQFPVFLKRSGIDPGRVNFVTTDVPGKYAAMLARRVQGSCHQVPTDALDYEGQNFPVARLLYADYGLDRLGHGLMTMNKLIKEQPQVVRGLLAGYMKGWKYAVDNPDESMTVVKKFFDTNLSQATLAAQWKAALEFHKSKRTKDKAPGWMDTADWEDTQKLLVEAEFLQQTAPVDRFFTNEFLPPS